HNIEPPYPHLNRHLIPITPTITTSTIATIYSYYKHYRRYTHYPTDHPSIYTQKNLRYVTRRRFLCYHTN
ncbi:MAG: hypothetical protein UH853_00760, partial [Muribaculaceae bacterium]|nr:hypothetical protein [Muribaculaceae bacterium]